MPRKKPASGKQKKKQLQEKKLRKQDGPRYLADLSTDDDGDDAPHCNASTVTSKPKVDSEETHLMCPTSLQGPGNVKSADSDVASLVDFVARLEVQKINQQPQEKNSKFDVKSFKLHFFKESDESIKRKKKDAQRPIKVVDEKILELRTEEVYPPDVHLDFPRRPPWLYTQSKEQLETQEQNYFKSYLQRIISQPRSQELSYFELNLETWRQLWRVLEISDVLLVIADIRYPVLHIPPSLISYIIQDLHKRVIIILNKVDFVPAILALSWKQYIETSFPGVDVIFFSSYPRLYLNSESATSFDPSKSLYKRPFKGKHIPIGPKALYERCLNIVKDKVDLSPWKLHIEDDHMTSVLYSQTEKSLDLERCEACHNPSHDSRQQTRYKDGILTIGCIGYPNVGKSSVLNAVVKKKVVSVSQTPGHTKHLQTIFLCPTVKLCDCPGLVFPSMVSKSLQVIAGIFPVAQVREPCSVVGYVAERVSLPSVMRLQPPMSSPNKRNTSSDEYIWSSFDICEAFALKNGFFTSKAGRPDVYRAANKILRLAVEGQICLCFRPTHYTQNADIVKREPETHELARFLASHSTTTSGYSDTSKHLDERMKDDSDEDTNEATDSTDEPDSEILT